MYCTQCGYRIDENMRFCTSCGAVLRRDAQQNVWQNVRQDAQQNVWRDTQPVAPGPAPVVRRNTAGTKQGKKGTSVYMLERLNAMIVK